MNDDPKNSLRSCTSCRARKIRCDKLRPSCHACVKNRLSCEYPTTTRRAAPRPRRDVVLMERLAKLEAVIGELATGGGPTAAGGGRRDAGDGNLEACGSGGGSGDTTRGLGELEAGLGKLLVSEGKSRYISPRFWASLSEEVGFAFFHTLPYPISIRYLRRWPFGGPIRRLTMRVADLKSLIEESPPATATSPASPDETLVMPLSHLFRSPAEDLSTFYPTPAQAARLYEIFVVSVDPVVRLLHKPTFESKLARLQEHDPLHPDRGFEALAFSVYYAAVNSLHPDNVQQMFGTDKPYLLNKYRVAVELALANAGFLQSEELMTLQALVLFISCSRAPDDTRTPWVLVGVAIRIAQSMGLHRDGESFNINPLETEIRRRLWYEICLLDLRTAEEHGSDPGISTRSYDTKLPLNIEDTDILPNSAYPIIPRKGFTEMTFCLIRFEVLDCLRVVAKSTPGAGKVKGAEQLTLGEKEKMLDELASKLRTKYQAGLDLTIPIQKITDMVIRLMVGRALLSLYHPLRHFKDGSLLNQEKKDKRLFRTAVEALECSAFLVSDRDIARYDQWNWLFQKYNQAHATGLVLSELIVRPPFGTDRMVERAWAAMDLLLDSKPWKREHPLMAERVWRQLDKLKDKALARRRRARQELEMAQRQRPSESLSPGESDMWEGVDVEDAPIDWREWDEMFQYIKMDIE
ncbi:unnamed protein product [Tuber aestivum]|uniref:Zn(2)-C6 fungal-type domain-containing protein n=1 Tax=Tuber aestivum TaxID=59557 RepID=A0A292PKV6_9PEZI|nr:unnamed protein product [Tuber aestivum]